MIKLNEKDLNIIKTENIIHYKYISSIVDQSRIKLQENYLF